MKIFARFNTSEEHEKLLNSMLKERMIREILERLRYFKNKGCLSLNDIEKYIEECAISTKE